MVIDEKKKSSVTAVVCDVFDRMAVNQEFNGIDLRKWCSRIEPSLKHKYDETFLRILRMHRRSQFICISRSKSKYRKVA